MTIPTIPPVQYQVAFNAAPNQTALPPWWSDLSSRVQFPWTTSRGRQYELDQNETGEWRPVLANNDGALDPSNTSSPFAPNVVPYRQARIRLTPGPNLLTPDQATCGQVTGYGPGQVPAQMQVVNDFGYAMALSASGTAFTGSQVYQTTVPSGATAFSTVLLLPYVLPVPGTTYSLSAQVRIDTAGQNIPMDCSVLWYNAAGTHIGSFGGSSVTVTGGSATWTGLSASGAVPPSGTVRAALKVEISSGGSTTATTLFEVGGLQWEAAPFATLFQVPNTTPVNLLPRVIATGSTSLALSDSVLNWWFGSGIAGQSLSQATGLTAAPSGHTTALAWQTPIGTTSATLLLAGNYLGLGTTGPQPDNVQVVAGTTYTASWWCSRASSADATVQVTPGIRWYNAAGALISTTSGTAVTVPVVTSWSSRITVSGAAPAGAVWGRITESITTPASTTAVNTVYSTGWQFEAAGVASTWADPGTVYQILNGFVERWPETWSEQNGTYGTSDLVAPDPFAALAQYTLPPPFVAEVMALNPNFFYQLNDPAGSTSCADTAAKRVAAPVENVPAGAGALTFGNSITSVNPASAFVGSPGPVATFNNTNVSTPPPNTQLAETMINLAKTTPTPGPPPVGNWTRILAFNAGTTVPGSGSQDYHLWQANPSSWASNLSSFSFVIINTGQLQVALHSAIGTNPTTAGSMCDGNWHLVGLSFNYSNSSAEIWCDSTILYNGSAGVGGFNGFGVDNLGCLFVPGQNSSGSGLIGSLAHCIELPIAVTQAQWTNLYNSFRTASSGESSGARISRILNWVGWTGPTSIATGQTASMGPATDLTGDAGLDAINAVTLTENGNFFASNTGVLTFQARNARYNQNVPAYIFGEQQSAGEWPFELLYFEDDPSHIANNVQITQYGGSVYTAIDAASTANNFPRVYQRTINTTSVPECQDAANYLLSQYKNATKRVQQLRLHPSAVPGLFNVCLALEIGTLIQVNRRPNGAPLTSFIGFVEKVAWSWDPHGDVYVDLQCSPLNKTQYWILAALHTTLNVQATSGTNTITINALPDAAVNKLNQSLPSGYTLVLDPGNPALRETVAIAPGGIPTTVLGYATAVLTLTANLAHTHAANAIVCEPLPAGVADPTTYDLLSVLGAASTTFALAATAGTNTITINALSDAKANAIASSIPQGWTLWLSPGTPNFEAVTVSPTGVPVTYPGYATVTLTLTANLAHNHALNDVVCDVLPAGDTSPSQVLATTILAY